MSRHCVSCRRDAVSSSLEPRSRSRKSVSARLVFFRIRASKHTAWPLPENAFDLVTATGSRVNKRNANKKFRVPRTIVLRHVCVPACPRVRTLTFSLGTQKGGPDLDVFQLERCFFHRGDDLARGLPRLRRFLIDLCVALLREPYRASFICSLRNV